MDHFKLKIVNDIKDNPKFTVALQDIPCGSTFLGRIGFKNANKNLYLQTGSGALNLNDLGACSLSNPNMLVHDYEPATTTLYVNMYVGGAHVR